MFVIREILLVSLVLLCSMASYPQEPLEKTFFTDEMIDLDKDHYSVSVIAGKASSKTPGLRKWLTKAKPLTMYFNANVKYATGDPIQVSYIKTFTAGENDFDSNLGFKKKLIDNLPGTATTQLDFKFFVPNEDRVGLILSSIEGDNGLATNLLTSPWIGYAKAVNGLMGKLLDTKRDHYLLSYSGSLNIGMANKMPSGYIVLLVPNEDEKSLNISMKGENVLLNGKEVEGHTYVLLRVFKDSGFGNLSSALTRNPDEQWTKFFRQKLTGPIFDARAQAPTSKEKFESLVDQLILEFGTLQGYFEADRRLTEYDVRTYMGEARKSAYDVVNDACWNNKVRDGDCPAPRLLPKK